MNSSPRILTSVFIAQKDGRPIAAIMLLTFRDRVSVEFSAIDESFKQYSPTHFLFWEAIKWASERGFRVIDFGRTSPNNTSLMEFKERWGTECIDLPQFFHPMHAAGSGGQKENGWKYLVIHRSSCFQDSGRAETDASVPSVIGTWVDGVDSLQPGFLPEDKTSALTSAVGLAIAHHALENDRLGKRTYFPGLLAHHPANRTKNPESPAAISPHPWHEVESPVPAFGIECLTDLGGGSSPRPCRQPEAPARRGGRARPRAPA